MDYNEKEARYRQYVLVSVACMVVLALVVLFLPPVRRWWDTGVVTFDKMTCYLCMLTLAVVVLGSRRKEKKLWGSVSTPVQPKTVLPFIISLVLLCVCEAWLANFIAANILHASEAAYDQIYNNICQWINAVYFVGVTIWIISAEANTRRVLRWEKAHAQQEKVPAAEEAAPTPPDQA